MLLYFFIISCSIGSLLLVLEKSSRQKNNVNEKTLLYIVGALSVAVLLSIYLMRGYGVGTDYPMYHSFYYFSTDALKRFGIENGYLVIYSIAKSLGMFWIVSLISFILYFSGFFILSRKLGLSLATFESMLILSYLFFTSFNMVRQMSAIGVVYLGIAFSGMFDFTQQFGLKRKILFILFVFLAAQFHSSAYVAVLFLLCRSINLNSRVVLFGSAIMSISYFLNIGNIIVPKIIYLFPHYVQKYSLIENDFFTSGSKGLIEYLPIFAQCMFLVIIIAYDSEFLSANKFMCNMYFVYLMLFAFGGNQAAIRIQDYWVPSMIYFYGAFFESKQNSFFHLSSKLFKSLVLLFLVIYVILRLFRNVSNVVPYYI
ncbi:EpsG family protein [Lacticaseibacillus suilingensis]|uniref:EpsG family protein n=1 Tax=Lacticaseibacillus suilingensis TaxID=2799577 RepID=A0ABW4BH67_9LACO